MEKSVYHQGRIPNNKQVKQQSNSITSSGAVGFLGNSAYTPTNINSFRSSSLSPQQQQQLLLLLNNHAVVGMGGSAASASVADGGTGGERLGLFGSRPPPPPPHFVHSAGPPPPRYFSLPTPHVLGNQSQQPPLLPLPFSRSASLPVVAHRRTASANAPTAAGRPMKEKQKKARLSSAGNVHPKKIDAAQLKKSPDRAPLPSGVTKADQKVEESEVVVAVDDEEEEEVVLVVDLEESVYSLSPPPSSLPLPRFSLKPRTGAPSTCNAEAADAGLAGDDLRRLLRL